MNHLRAALAKGVLALAAVTTGQFCLAVAAGGSRGEHFTDFLELFELLEQGIILQWLALCGLFASARTNPARRLLVQE